MDDDRLGEGAEPGWIAGATHARGADEEGGDLECIEARLALASALFGLLFLGFFFGPLALSLGQRARIRVALDPALGDEGLARAAHLIGKFALALHLAIVIGTLGWLFFSLPTASAPAG